MELYLGLVDGQPSRVKPIILRQNGIKTRYYALTKDQEITHTNVDLAKCAIDRLGLSEDKLNKIQFLSCGTSMPDQYLPSHAAMCMVQYLIILWKLHPLQECACLD